LGRPRTGQSRGQGPSGGNPRGGGGARDARGSRPRERGQREGSDLQDRVVEIRRVAKVVKGGRRFNFSALVVVGDGKGRVGVSLGKANTVPAAISKGQDRAKANMFDVPMRNTTIPHEVLGKFESSSVMLKPASEGTGVIAGGAVRAVMELAGVRDVLTKALGSTTAVNLVQATVDGLKQLRTKAQIEQSRGVKITL
jgi:small subunit ribosomal protein S5